jgi:hypothetical protein
MPLSQLHNYQELLLEMRANDQSYDSMVSTLDAVGCTTSVRSLKRYFKDQGLTNSYDALKITPQLVDQVKDLYLHSMLSDTQIALRTADHEGKQLSTRQVKRIRLQEGLTRRVKTFDAVNSALRTEAARADVSHLISEGSGRSFGSRWAQTHLRRRLGHYHRLHDVQSALREFDPKGVKIRSLHTRPPRQQNYTTDGPNEVWALDGHDKLAAFGFQIYAGIDAYSRRVIWAYCGTANRSSFSVLKQYLQAVKEQGHCPRFVRTDKGGETILAAAAHHTLYLEALAAELVENDGTNENLLECCWIWGPSWRNVKIERLWGQLGEEVTYKWSLLFQLIRNSGFYRDWLVADCVAILYTFMPILRHEIHEFLLDKNEYPTRKQKERANHVAGIPNQLYEEHDHGNGFPIHLETLQTWEATITGFGTVMSFLHSRSLPFTACSPPDSPPRPI